MLTKEQHAILEQIAREELFLDSLEIKHSGDDFQEQAVWCIKTALTRAFQEGQKSVK